MSLGRRRCRLVSQKLPGGSAIGLVRHVSLPWFSASKGKLQGCPVRKQQCQVRAISRPQTKGIHQEPMGQYEVVLARANSKIFGKGKGREDELQTAVLDLLTAGLAPTCAVRGSQ